jgi:hypothetical protein
MGRKDDVMTITEEMNAIIENDMAALDQEDVLRSGRSFEDFVDEFSVLLAQATEDEALLVAAGFDFSSMPRYRAYLEKLMAEHGARVVAEADTTASIEAFHAGMPRAEADKKVLMAVGRFVVARTRAPEARRVYKMVRKGRGQVDTLNDNIAMVGFVRRFSETAALVRPGGQAVDDAFLSRVEEDAVRLLKIRAEALTAGDDVSLQVDRQNRLITLCVLAERDIKLYAESAFYDDSDRYNRFYASRARRGSGTDEAPEAGGSEPAAAPQPS